jgi:hypothetical protein
MDGLRSEAPRSESTLSITKSAAEILADKNLPDRLVDILAVHGFLLGTNLADCPASFLSIVTASLLLSAWELGCTGSDMAEALADSARQAGVRVIVGDPVVAVDVDGGGACGVRLQSGAAIPAATVVSAIHPKSLAELLPPRRFHRAIAPGFSGWRKPVAAWAWWPWWTRSNTQPWITMSFACVASQGRSSKASMPSCGRRGGRATPGW